jgi:hypothetical protein
MSKERPEDEQPDRESTKSAENNPTQLSPSPNEEPELLSTDVVGPASPLAIAGVATLHCAVFGCAALLLPWRSYPTFSAFTALLAFCHTATVWSALVRRAWLARVWRSSAFLALAWLALLTWSVGTSAWYVHRIYGALGNGIAVALLIGWCIPILFTVPFSAWAIAATRRPQLKPSHGKVEQGSKGAARKLKGFGSAAGVVLLTAFLSWQKLAAASTIAVGREASDAEQLKSLIVGALPRYSELKTTTGELPPLSLDPSDCRAPVPKVGATLFIHYRASHGDRVLAVHHCIQDDNLAGALAKAKALLSAQALKAPIKLDVVIGHSPLVSGDPLLDGLKLRPGLDGVCLKGRCLLGWQLAARHMLNQHDPIAAIPELRMGFSPARVREALGHEPVARLDGLERIATYSYLYAKNAERLSRMHLEEQPLDKTAVARAGELAEQHIVRALDRNGRYRYQLDPFDGTIDSKSYNLPRQAGTTLVLCEFGSQETQQKHARAALEQMASLELRSGEKSLLLPEAGERFIPLGHQALPLIAFLACRNAVGHDFDKLVGRLARTVLALQRPRGDFFPEWDIDRYEPRAGAPPLFSPGQAVMALVLLEQAIQEQGSPHFPELPRVRQAVERAMRYYGEQYWDFSLGRLFYVEENWHCLAARAALGHHRVDSYERFCIDHAQFKANFTITEDSPTRDMVGAFALAPLIPPPNTATAGVGEALAAAIALQQARGESSERGKAQLRRILRFLLRQQWTEVTCFACQNSDLVVGGFSDSMLTPTLRIDFTQHAWAAIAHGSKLLALPKGSPSP